MKKSIYEIFTEQLLAKNGYKFVEQFRFCPDRRWRFDFADIDNKIAIEVNGGVWIKGKHTHGNQYEKDLEKINTAQIMGWKVLQYTPETLQNIIKDLEKIKTADY